MKVVKKLAKHTAGVTQEVLQDLFVYDKALGVLRWRESRGGKRKGDIAGGLGTTGYYTVRVNRVLYKLHRLMYLYHHGIMPEIVDHIDRDKANNRITNLRPATISENNANQKIRVDNSSGIKGVSLHKGSGNWVAKIKGRTIGYFKDLEKASKAYDKAAKKEFGKFYNDTRRK